MPLIPTFAAVLVFALFQIIAGQLPFPFNWELQFAIWSVSGLAAIATYIAVRNALGPKY